MKLVSVESLDYDLEVFELLEELDYTDLLDKPFELGARGPDAFDCWGLCVEVGRRVGIDYPFILSPVEQSDQNDTIIKATSELFEKIEKPEPYCISTYIIHRPFVSHCGIILPDGLHFLHIMVNHSVVRQRLDVYQKRLEGFYRLKSDADN